MGFIQASRKEEEPLKSDDSNQADRDAILTDLTQRDITLTARVWPRFDDPTVARVVARRGAWIIFGWAALLEVHGFWQRSTTNMHRHYLYNIEAAILTWLGVRIYRELSSSAAWASLTAVCFVDWQLIVVAFNAHLRFLGTLVVVITHMMINCVRATHAYSRLVDGSASNAVATGSQRSLYQQVAPLIDAATIVMFLLSGIISLRYTGPLFRGTFMSATLSQNVLCFPGGPTNMTLPPRWSIFRYTSGPDGAYYELYRGLTAPQQVSVAWLPTASGTRTLAIGDYRNISQLIDRLSQMKLSLESNRSLDYSITQRKLAGYEKPVLSSIYICRRPAWIITLRNVGPGGITYWCHRVVPYDKGALVISDFYSSIDDVQQTDATLAQLLAAVPLK